MQDEESATVVRAFLDQAETSLDWAVRWFGGAEIVVFGADVRQRILHRLVESGALAAVELALESVGERISTFMDERQRAAQDAKNGAASFYYEESAMNKVYARAEGDRKHLDEIEDEVTNLLLLVADRPREDSRVVSILLKSLIRGQCVGSSVRGKLESIARTTTSIPALILLLEQGDDVVAYDAAQALGRIGPDATEAVPALRKYKASCCANNRAWTAAEDALSKIRP